jgi:hypothetical protein
VIAGDVAPTTDDVGQRVDAERHVPHCDRAPTEADYQSRPVGDKPRREGQSRQLLWLTPQLATAHMAGIYVSKYFNRNSLPKYILIGLAVLLVASEFLPTGGNQNQSTALGYVDDACTFFGTLMAIS